VSCLTDDIKLLVEPINTEHEKTKIQGRNRRKEYNRDKRANVPVDALVLKYRTTRKTKTATASFQNVAKSVTFEGTYEVEIALI
jgi:hypothetical protein